MTPRNLGISEYIPHHSTKKKKNETKEKLRVESAKTRGGGV